MSTVSATSVPPSVSVIGMTLPRAEALTDALLAPALDTVSEEQLAEIRRSLVAELEFLAKAAPRRLPPHIGAYELAMALEHPQRCVKAVREPFVISPVRCRRAIGVAAVQRCARGHCSSPQRAVSEILCGALEDVATAQREAGSPRPAWWAEWYAGLPPGGRAVVEAEAVTWATQLWSAIDWDRFERPPVLTGRDDSWRCPGPCGLLLRGRVDVRAVRDDRQAFLVVAAGFPRASWRPQLAYPALVAALARGRRAMPARVIGVWPASGLVRICEVDQSALGEAAAALVIAAKTYSKSLDHEPARETASQCTGVQQEAV